MGSAIPVVAVTGGTLGIGRHAVDVLAADGTRVGVCARRKAAAVAVGVTASHAVLAVGIDADVANTEAFDQLATAVVRELGAPIGVLCCRASGSPWRAGLDGSARREGFRGQRHGIPDPGIGRFRRPWCLPEGQSRGGLRRDRRRQQIHHLRRLPKAATTWGPVVLDLTTLRNAEGSKYRRNSEVSLVDEVDVGGEG